MRILLLGGTGHTGERLAMALLKRGHQLCVLSRRDKTDPVLNRLIGSGASGCQGSANHLWKMMEAADACDLLVSCSHIRYAEACQAVCETLGIKRYLQMSSTRGLTRFHHHPGVQEVRLGEKAITNSSLDYTIIRPTMIFGGPRDGNVERLVQWFHRHRWFPLFGRGENLVQPVYVDDLVELMVECIEDKRDSQRKTITVGGPHPIKWREFLVETAKTCGVRKPVLLSIPLGLTESLLHLCPESLRPISLDFLERQREDKIVPQEEENIHLGQTPYTKALKSKVDLSLNK